MKLDKTKPIRRIAVYFFYDKDGIVDDYIPYLLRDLVKNVEKLIFVSNGPLTAESKEKLAEFNPVILERENKGLDVWAYKEAMLSVGWQELARYQEVVLLNYTLMGPVHPFKEAFDAMAERNVHFWGLTRHYGLPFDPWKSCKYGYVPMHIQSSFMVFRSDFIQAKAFQHYWETVPLVRTYAESIGWHEAIFTEDFTRMGFKSDVYVNTDDLKDYHEYPMMLYPRELVENRGCPVFKRKVFYNIYNEYIEVSPGQAARDLYQYLEQKTDYDLNMIWDVLLRTAHMSDIKERLQLNYILPDQIKLPDDKPALKAALLLHIYYDDQMDYCLRYAKNTPDDMDIFISTDSVEKKEAIESVFAALPNRKVKVVMIENRGRDVSALLVGFKPYVMDYDVVCTAHDKKTNYFQPFIIGESFAYHCFENVLGSREYVENVLKTFKDNPRLGLLVPPTPNFGPWASLPGNEWLINYDAAEKYARELGITVPMSNANAPIAPLGTIFWFRTKALALLFDQNYTYEDFPVEPTRVTDGTIMHSIERIYPFAAQQAGYYSAWVMTLSYSQLNITNYHKITKDYHVALAGKIGFEGRQYYLDLINQGHSLNQQMLAESALKAKVKKFILKVAGPRGLNKASGVWRKIK